jgi:hypothetical protein
MVRIRFPPAVSLMRTATIGALDNLCNLPRGSDERRAPGRKSRSIDGKDDVWFGNLWSWRNTDGG